MIIESTTFNPHKKHYTNALVYLVQNKKFTKKNQFGFARENVTTRIELFFKSLSYFIDHQNHQDESVDIHIFHEGDLEEEHFTRTTTIAKRCLVFFHHVEFRLPEWISSKEVNESIASNTTPGWRDMGYRHMCRFYSILIYPQLLRWGYRKMMRLDDDSFVMEPLPLLFKSVSPENPYKCRLLQQESNKFAYDFYQEYHAFCDLYKIPCPDKSYDFYVIPFNNMFVLDLSIYERTDVKNYLQYMDKTGGIYRYRWGDALIQGVMIRQLCNIRDISLFRFSYSKWGITFDKDHTFLELYEDMLPLEELKGRTSVIFIFIACCTIIIFLLFLIK